MFKTCSFTMFLLQKYLFYIIPTFAQKRFFNALANDFLLKLFFSSIFKINIVIFQVAPYGFEPKDKDLLKYIMVTKIGSGPKCIDNHLLNSDGTIISK